MSRIFYKYNTTLKQAKVIDHMAEALKKIILERQTKVYPNMAMPIAYEQVARYIEEWNRHMTLDARERIEKDVKILWAGYPYYIEPKFKGGNQEDVAPGYYSKAAAPIAIPFADEIQKIKDSYGVTITRADEIELIAIGLNKKNIRDFYNTSMTHEFEKRNFDLSCSETLAAQKIVQMVTQWAKQAEKEKLRMMKDLLVTIRTAFYRQQ